MEKYYAREDYFYAGDSIFTIPFPYIEKKHIDVFINNVLTTSYDFLTDYSIKINTDIVTGDIISIRRNTPIKERMVVWKNGSILKEESQNLADKQVIYAVQENNDRNEEFVNISETVKDSLFEIQEAKETCLETVDKVEQIRDDVNEQKNQSQIYINNALDNVKDTTDNLLDIIESKSNFVTRNIGEIVTSTIPLNDAGLHLLDGALIQYGAYSAFIDYMAKLFVTNPELFCTQEEYDQTIVDYGICGKYVYDSVANTVRLPTLSGFLEGTIDKSKVGDIVEAAIPNFTCQFGWAEGRPLISKNSPNATQGACRQGKYVGGNNGLPGGGVGDGYFVQIDPSITSSVYKDDCKTVQPQATLVHYYIVVATTKKTDVEVNIDKVMADVNGKADKDLSNVSRLDYVPFAETKLIYSASNASSATITMDWLPDEPVLLFLAFTVRTANNGLALLAMQTDIAPNIEVFYFPGASASRKLGATTVIPSGNKTLSISFPVYDAGMSEVIIRCTGYMKIKVGNNG